MSFSPGLLILVSLGYLGLLGLLAQATETGKLPTSWVRHPLTYTLSLGVFAGTWAIYGSVGIAYEFGYGYLAYYLGICGAFLLAPVLMQPILRITRAYQLSSLADLFAFRYRSQWAGTLVAISTAIAILPLLSLQIAAISKSVHLLLPGVDEPSAAIAFSLLMALLSMLVGGRRQAGSEDRNGLVIALAFGSAFKLLAILILGSAILYQVFGGTGGLDDWLQNQAPRVSALDRRFGDGAWHALLLMSFAAAFVLPHMFHMGFGGHVHHQSLARASWGLPLYLLLLSLPIPIILWAGISLGAPTEPDYFAIGVTLLLKQPALALLAFLAGLSAASGLIIALTQGLSGMLLNHLILPLNPPKEQADIYQWLLNSRRSLIAVTMLLALLFHFYAGGLSLKSLGVLAFSGALQLLPGLLGVIYWPEGNRKGVIAGLLSGLACWAFTLALPMMLSASPQTLAGLPFAAALSSDHWHIFVLSSLAINITVFGLVSMTSLTTREENSAAQSCSLGALSRPQRRELTANSSDDFKQQLETPLGRAVAEREVSRALIQLDLPPLEYRPYQLRRLRDQVEVNLSGLLGPAVAQDMVKRFLSYKPMDGTGPAQDIHYMERMMEDYQTRLTGLAAELDNLRRHYRQTLQNLPIAACSIGSDAEILMWNQAMMSLTDIDAELVVGASVNSLPEPWSKLIGDFVDGDETHRHKHRQELHGRPHWLNLHKSAISGPEHPESGMVLLIEDQTETHLLEDELIHSQRLASVGRLAAGVAHEIGNPVTGIACLAQNLQLETDDEEVLHTAEQIIQQTKRVSRILQSLMHFSRSGNHSQSHHHQPVSIRRCIEDAIALLSLGGTERNIRYLDQCPDDLLVLGDDQRLAQVFINLLSNARDASNDGGIIYIAGKREGYSAIIEVCDQGCGIAEDQLDHVFEPFYTTKDPDKGTGLGLSLVYSIVEEHYGSVQAESPTDPEKACGTRIILRFPDYQDTYQDTYQDSYQDMNE